VRRVGVPGDGAGRVVGVVRVGDGGGGRVRGGDRFGEPVGGGGVVQGLLGDRPAGGVRGDGGRALGRVPGVGDVGAGDVAVVGAQGRRHTRGLVVAVAERLAGEAAGGGQAGAVDAAVTVVGVG